MKRLGHFLIAALAALLTVNAASAATLYISEFQNGVGVVGTSQVQAPPQSAITDQIVAVGVGSAQSAAFNAKTNFVLLTCDTGCSVLVGSNPTATTSNFLLSANETASFVVSPGQKVAVIANSAGGAGGGTATVVPSSAAAAGIVPSVTAASGSSQVVCATACNLYGFNLTSGASAGTAYVFNAAALPGNGAVTPSKCYQIAANSSIGVSYEPPIRMSTGATVGFGTGTNCFSLAASATAFISGEAK